MYHERHMEGCTESPGVMNMALLGGVKAGPLKALYELPLPVGLLSTEQSWAMGSRAVSEMGALIHAWGIGGEGTNHPAITPLPSWHEIKLLHKCEGIRKSRETMWCFG